VVKLSFIVLTWNSQETIKDCLESIGKLCLSENIPFEVILVDNNSTDSTREIVRSLEEEMKLITILMDKNHGTTHTRNIALRRARGEYICFMDSDTKLIAGSLPDFIEHLQIHKDIGIAAPKLILPDERVAASVKKFPLITDKFLKLIYLLIFGKDGKQYKGDYYEDFPFSNERNVDTAISACWFFRKELLDQTGYLDEKIFFGPEDIEFCLRVWKAKRRVVYYPSFVVLHCTQSLARVKPFSRIMLNHILGLLHIFLRHKYFFRRPKILL